MRRVIFSAYMTALALFTGLVAAPRQATAGSMTYLAIGDSLAFGETNFSHNPSYGDRGYVSLVANALASQNGGVRPNVINLGVDGETTSSFFSGGQSTMPWNLNYSGTTVSQDSVLQSDLAAQQAAGNTVSDITVSLGANDLFAVMQSPNFFNQSSSQQFAAILASMSTIQNNYTNLLIQLHAEAPGAQISLVGYYNPYAAVPGAPPSQLAGPAIQLLNAVIAGEAAAFGDHYVDTYSAFLGHEAQYTYITDSPPGTNVHPNDLGYSVIAGHISPVPEPSSALLLSLFGIGAISCRVRTLKHSRI